MDYPLLISTTPYLPFRGWLYRVNQFFLLDSVADDQKVRLVSMHMFDKALNWHKQFIRKNCENVQWTVYEREEQFEALMNKVELSEAYAVSLFIGGLKDEISMSVRMFKPNTLTDVYCLAKMQGATLHVLKTKQTPLLTTPKAPYTNSYANKSMTYPPKTTTITLAIPAPPNTELTKSAYVQPRKQLTQKEIADKRAKNLCFYCDEKFVPGHKCSGQLLEIMSSLYECKGFKWTLQGVEFTSDVLILPLGGCEMVLSSAHTTPFDIVYGKPPNLHLPYIASTTSVEEMDRAIAMLQFHVKRSQERIKNMADKNRSDKNFELKLCKGINHQVGSLLEYGRDGVLSVELEAIIGKRLGKLNNKAVLYVLVKWVNQAEEDATWELYTDLIKRHGKESVHMIDICDSTFEDLIQKVFHPTSGIPTPTFEPLIEFFSPSPTPSEGSDLLLGETDTLIRSYDNSWLELEAFCFEMEEKSNGSPTSLYVISLPIYEAFSFDNHTKEKSSGSTTTHSYLSLLAYDSFRFDLTDDHILPTKRSDFLSEEFTYELSHIISPPEYDSFHFGNEDIVISLSGSPTHSFDSTIGFPSQSLTSFKDIDLLLEETDTLIRSYDNSLLELEAFCFHMEEKSSGSPTSLSVISLPIYEAFSFNNHTEKKSSGSTTTHSYLSLHEYDSFRFDLTDDHILPTKRSDFLSEKFTDELSNIISPPKYDSFHFGNEDIVISLSGSPTHSSDSTIGHGQQSRAVMKSKEAQMDSRTEIEGLESTLKPSHRRNTLEDLEPSSFIYK
ncbi:gypsy/ty3 retroelement polyprotein [Tanacetum coccineum]